MSIFLNANPNVLSAPIYAGDPDAEQHLAEALRAAYSATEAFGTWPAGTWTVHLHTSSKAFEEVTGSPPVRAAVWIGNVLHLRPWEQLKRRDLSRVLRHELVHRRHNDRPWVEEALCLWAEGHTRPLEAWPEKPEAAYQDRLDVALRRGKIAEQAWAYRWLRAWLERKPLPLPPAKRESEAVPWRKEALRLDHTVTVRWPPERVKTQLVVNGQELVWRPGSRHCYEGQVRFGESAPVRELEGHVEIQARRNGWAIAWTLPARTWVAAACAGELGEDVAQEAKRALAAVLMKWLEAHPQGNHPDGSFCPLTHCAVVRGQPSLGTLDAAAQAPTLKVDGRWAFFCGSKGGVSFTPREAWGGGPEFPKIAERVPGDRWSAWTRTLSASQVRMLKRLVKPGLRQGQKGLRLGDSGPYAVEDLRLAAGRSFGWTTWPSNACVAELQSDGSLALNGHGWGHNVGLCLATAIHRAREGWEAEAILEEAFGSGKCPSE